MKESDFEHFGKVLECVSKELQRLADVLELMERRRLYDKYVDSIFSGEIDKNMDFDYYISFYDPLKKEKKSNVARN